MKQQLQNIATYLSILALVFLFLGCVDDESNIVELRGVIVEGAGVGQDCEYIFQPDAGSYLVPQFVPIQFQEDGIQVFIKGEILAQKAACSSSNDNGFLIRIEQISAN